MLGVRKTCSNAEFKRLNYVVKNPPYFEHPLVLTTPFTVDAEMNTSWEGITHEPIAREVERLPVQLLRFLIE